VTKKLLRVLAGEAVWPPTIWLMRQAGRYLPEFRALKTRTGDFIARCTTPEIATEITLQPLRRYPLDAAILFSDILMLPWALGHGLEFAAEGPVMPRIVDQAGVDALDFGRVEGAIAPIIETVRRVRAALDQQTLIGFAGSPFTVACYMVEGGGSRDHALTRQMAYSQPALFDSLIERLTEATELYLAAQIEAGAEVVMLFDSWGGVLSPTLFRRHVTVPTKRLAAYINRRYPHIPVIGFPRLAGNMLASYAIETGVACVGMDTATDPAVAAATIPPTIAVQGNLDPLSVVAGGAAMRGEAEAILSALRGRPHIFNLGHGLVPQTPPEHVGALVDFVQAGMA